MHGCFCTKKQGKNYFFCLAPKRGFFFFDLEKTGGVSLRCIRGQLLWQRVNLHPGKLYHTVTVHRQPRGHHPLLLQMRVGINFCGHRLNIGGGAPDLFFFLFFFFFQKHQKTSILLVWLFFVEVFKIILRGRRLCRLFSVIRIGCSPSLNGFQWKVE